MQDYYDLGVIAAVSSVQAAADDGDLVAQKVASLLPDEFNSIPEEVKTAAWDHVAAYEEKYAGAKWDATKKFVGTLGSKVKDVSKAVGSSQKKRYKDIKDYSKAALTGSESLFGGKGKKWKGRAGAAWQATKKSTPELLIGGGAGVGFGTYYGTKKKK